MKKVAVIKLAQKLSQFSDLWSPKIVAELNDSYIKLAKLKGEYVWHKHENEDEMFFVISGDLTIELRDTTLSLQPGDIVVIPKGVEHKPVAPSEVHVMLIEPKTTLSTGDSANTEDKKPTHGEWI
jgi:mannose-6-phosphate isomerase-like protein (cupin superfamily)